MTQDKNELVFCPLGGAGEIGMNMNLYGYGSQDEKKWIMIDIGVGFTDDSVPGIDLMVADPDFIVQRKKDLLDNIKDDIPDKNFSQSDLIAKLMSKSLAIKNGKKLLKDEQEYIMNSLFACKEPTVSPFNKNIYFTITFEELEKKFI